MGSVLSDNAEVPQHASLLHSSARLALATLTNVSICNDTADIFAHQEQTIDMVLGLGTRLETAAQGKNSE